MYKSDKKVAFLTAAYNGEKTLQRTINSIKAQTYQNFEYFILNDGSSDSTQSIIDENSRLDPRIHSVSFSENNCQVHFIEAIKEILKRDDIDYFAICDHDDEYLPEFAETAVESCERTGADTACVQIFYNAVGHGEHTIDYVAKETVIKTPDEFAVYYPAALCSMMRTQWGKLFSIKAIRKTNLDVINIAKYGRDTIFCNEVVKNSDSVVLIPKPLYRFYIEGASETSRVEDERITAPAKLFKCAEDFVAKKCGNDYACSQFIYINYLNDLYLVTIQTIHSDIPNEKKIDFLIQIYSDPIFDAVAQKPNIGELFGTTGGGKRLSFEMVTETAANAFAQLFPYVTPEKSKKFASLATYTAVLAGYMNPKIPTMGNGPKAVILTLCYNSGEVLNDAVKSVLTQTYWNFDYILVDNASTDNTREKILEIEKLDPRIHHIFYDENKFPDIYADLIPKILENEEYKYFAICDHDDELFPRFLEVAINTAEKENAELVLGGEQYYNPESQQTDILQLDRKIVIDTPKSYSENLVNFIWFTAWFGRLFGADLLRKTDLSSNTKLVRAHDIILTLDAIEKSRRSVILPDMFYRHYLNEGSGSAMPDKRNVNSTTMQYEKCIEVYNKRAAAGEEQRTFFNNMVCENLLRDLLLAIEELNKCEINSDCVYIYIGYLDKPVFTDLLINYATKTYKAYFIQTMTALLRKRESLMKFADEEQRKQLDKIFGILEKEIKKLTA